MKGANIFSVCGSLNAPSPAPPRISVGIPPPLAQFDGTLDPRALPPTVDPIAAPGARNNSRPRPCAGTRRQSLFRRKPPVKYPGDTSFRDSVSLAIRFLPALPSGGYPLPAPCPGMPLPARASTWDCPSSAARLAALPSFSPAASALKLAPNLTIPSLHPVQETGWPAPHSRPPQKQERRFASYNLHRSPKPCRTRSAPHPSAPRNVIHTTAKNARTRHPDASAPVRVRRHKPGRDFRPRLPAPPVVQLRRPVRVRARALDGTLRWSADIPPRLRPRKSNRSNTADPTPPTPARNSDPG